MDVSGITAVYIYRTLARMPNAVMLTGIKSPTVYQVKYYR